MDYTTHVKTAIAMAASKAEMKINDAKQKSEFDEGYTDGIDEILLVLNGRFARLEELRDECNRFWAESYKDGYEQGVGDVFEMAEAEIAPGVKRDAKDCSFTLGFDQAKKDVRVMLKRTLGNMRYMTQLHRAHLKGYGKVFSDVGEVELPSPQLNVKQKFK